MASLHTTYGPDAPKVLQGGMIDQADKIPLPPRFTVKYTPEGNAVILIDTETGKASRVGLFAYRAVRQTLSDLFGE